MTLEAIQANNYLPKATIKNKVQHKLMGIGRRSKE